MQWNEHNFCYNSDFPRDDNYKRDLIMRKKHQNDEELSSAVETMRNKRNVETLRLTINTYAQLQDDQSAQIFSNLPAGLQDIGHGEVELHQNTKHIKLPGNFCNAVQTTKELIESVFLDILYNYICDDWLCNPVTWAEKNVDVDEINFQIQRCHQLI
ncbi:ATP-dependent DNA helicase [Trichonephila clavipes]|nr:ATP-dependent DNA helicase [Trichonephila clavipes]